MTTVAEKQADVATLIDDWAATATSLAAWSDADAGVVNDQSTNDWFNNGRVLENTNMGVFVLMYVSYNEFDSDTAFNTVHGIRMVVSTSWDSTNSLPAGNTNVTGQDAMSASVTNHRNDSFTNVDFQNGSMGVGVWVFESGPPNANSRSTTATESATYFLSVTNDHFAIGAWNTTSGNYGVSCQISVEHVDSKFWADGNTPVAYVCATLADVLTGYGFSATAYDSDTNTPRRHLLGNDTGSNHGCIEPGDWGTINADGNDDTFFFRRPAIYETKGRNAPVGYYTAAIPNIPNGGAAHGDTITYNSTDHRVIEQTGASGGQTISAALKYV